MDAAKSLEGALALEPRLCLGYDILKIHSCFHQKKCDQAVTLLRKAVKYCPDYYGYNYGLAEVYVKMGLHSEALETRRLL
ncbi:MAG: tetratricopeptide repeat protein [Emcibacter sp.]|nr:tetratricopeptide repeat protein [Emcibacter sp.]